MWLGGDLGQKPARWAGASPAERAGAIRTPTLLLYAAAGHLAAQGEVMAAGLARAGVPHRLVTVADADHTFSAQPAQDRLRREVVRWFRAGGSGRPG